MHKTSVYLTDELREALTATAAARGESEAAVVRAAIAHEVGVGRPRPGIIASRGGRGGSRTAEAVDEALAASGFGT